MISFSTRHERWAAGAPRSADNRDVLARDGRILLVEGGRHTTLVPLADVPFTAGGRIPFQVQNALAAAAAAWGAGLDQATIARALTTFRTDPTTVPGRFNVLELNGVQVIVDYAHNEAALRVLGEAVQALGRRHTIMAIGLPGDRRDDDLLASMRATIPYVDEYVLCEHGDRRGRACGEVPQLLRRALDPTTPVAYAASQAEGILCAWGRAGPGARLIVIPRDVDESLALLNGLATPAPHHCAGRAAQWRIAQGESTEQGERRETARLEAQRRAALM